MSSDDIRQQLMGSKYDASRGKEVWTEYYRLLELALQQGDSAVADATNLSSDHRRKCRELAGKHNAQIHAVVFKNVSQAVRRNLSRDGGYAQGDRRVPDKAMVNFVMLYERMLVDIESEVYQSVTYIERTA